MSFLSKGSKSESSSVQVSIRQDGGSSIARSSTDQDSFAGELVGSGVGGEEKESDSFIFAKNLGYGGESSEYAPSVLGPTFPVSGSGNSRDNGLLERNKPHPNFANNRYLAGHNSKQSASTLKKPPPPPPPIPSQAVPIRSKSEPIQDSRPAGRRVSLDPPAHVMFSQSQIVPDYYGRSRGSFEEEEDDDEETPYQEHSRVRDCSWIGTSTGTSDNTPHYSLYETHPVDVSSSFTPSTCNPSSKVHASGASSSSPPASQEVSRLTPPTVSNDGGGIKPRGGGNGKFRTWWILFFHLLCLLLVAGAVVAGICFGTNKCEGGGSLSLEALGASGPTSLPISAGASTSRPTEEAKPTTKQPMMPAHPLSTQYPTTAPGTPSPAPTTILNCVSPAECGDDTYP